MKGSYVLLIELKENTNIKVGKLGTLVVHLMVLNREYKDT